MQQKGLWFQGSFGQPANGQFCLEISGNSAFMRIQSFRQEEAADCKRREVYAREQTRTQQRQNNVD
jgi:hypothetical protein